MAATAATSATLDPQRQRRGGKGSAAAGDGSSSAAGGSSGEVAHAALLTESIEEAFIRAQQFVAKHRDSLPDDRLSALEVGSGVQGLVHALYCEGWKHNGGSGSAFGGVGHAAFLAQSIEDAC